MTTNPSKDWTPEERLKVINEMTTALEQLTTLSNVVLVSKVIATIHVIASESSIDLERQREDIVQLVEHLNR